MSREPLVTTACANAVPAVVRSASPYDAYAGCRFFVGRIDPEDGVTVRDLGHRFWFSPELPDMTVWADAAVPPPGGANILFGPASKAWWGRFPNRRPPGRPDSLFASPPPVLSSVEFANGR